MPREPDNPEVPRTAARGALEMLRRFALPAAILAVGVGVAVAAFDFVLRNSFQFPARQYSAAISHHIGQALGQVELMGAFRESNPGMTREEFFRFSSRVLAEESGLVVLSWIPRVLDADRAAFEAQVRRGGFPAYAVTEAAEDGGQVPAGRKAEYFPVLHVAPLELETTGLGFDISTHPVRQAALETARDTGTLAVTGKINLLSGIDGVLVLAPVYASGPVPASVEERRQRFAGVIVGAVRLSALLADALEGYEFPIGLDAQLIDLDAEGAARRLTALPSPRRTEGARPIPGEDLVGDISRFVDLPAGDRTWRLIVTPAPISKVNPFRVAPGGLGIAITLLAALIAWIASSHASRQREIETRVHTRTRELRESEEQSRLITDTIPVLVAYVDSSLHYRFVNRTMERWFDRPLARIVGHPVEEVIGPEIFSRIRSRIDAVLSGNEISFANAMTYPDGRYREVEATYLPDFDEDGRVLGYFIMVVDVTDWRRLEREIESFFSLNLGLMAIASFEGRFNKVNPAWESTLGYSPEELTGRPFQDFIHPDDAESARQEIARLVQSGHETRGFEVRFVHKNGDIRLLSWFATALPEQQVLLGTATDVTDQRRSEVRLREAQERAVSAAQAKSELLTNISHEIRTPLNAVVGFSDIVLQSDIAPKQRDQVRKIRTSGQILLDLVDDILDLSKIEAGRLSLELIPFSLSEMMENVAGLMGVRAGDKGIDLAFAVDPGIPDAMSGDPVRLSQVLMNLTGNALKFTDDGEVRVRVRLIAREDDIARLRFEVRDTGIGLTPDEQERLFQPFIQADPSTSRRYGGTGLGLALSREILELMGGEIGVESEEGVGSRFWFTAPFPVIGRTTVAAPDVSRILVTGEPSQRRGWVLAALAPSSDEVAVAESADAAVAALAAAAGRGAPFEAVVVQLAGAGGPGAAFLHRIRATESGAAARVVAVAPPGGGDLGVEWSALGVDQFVPDPPTSMRLAQALSGVDTVTAREDTAQPAGSDLLAGLHVLLVEDSELNQEVAAEMMGQSGAVVTITSNAAEALRQIEAHPKRFGVVLMDLQMPGMDGTTATRVIRETRPADDLPIVAFTAHALSEERDRALAAGMNDYLIKPVTRVQLIQALRKWTPPAGPDTPVSGEAEEQIALPASSEPLDLTTAIRNLGLPEPVILSLVGKFRVQYADTREQVTAALDAGDTGTAAGLVHKVRGSAGYLQASELYEAAGLLEEELQNGAPVSALPHLHRAFDAALAEALDAAAALEAGA